LKAKSAGATSPAIVAAEHISAAARAPIRAVGWRAFFFIGSAGSGEGSRHCGSGLGKRNDQSGEQFEA